MPFVEPTPTNYDHCKWIRRELALDAKFDPFVSELADMMLDHSGRRRNRNGNHNAGNIRRAKQAISIVLGNIYKYHLIDPHLYCAIPLSNGANEAGQYNPLELGRRALQELVDFLKSEGPQRIVTYAGNLDRAGGANRGLHTRVLPTEVLITELEDFISLNNLITTDDPKGNTLQEDISPITRTSFYDLDPIGISVGSLFKVAPLPQIRMKNHEKELIEAPDTPEAAEMDQRLSRFNEFIEDHWIDLCLPDNQFQDALKNRDPDEVSITDRDNDTRIGDLVHGRRMYRVFNNETFEDGGRFYGGWWQSIRSEYRKYLTINWHPVTEIDYSNMHLAMLYAREGRELPEDAYLIKGLEDQRKLVKVTLLKMINATGRMEDNIGQHLSGDWTFEGLQEALKTKHEPIAHYLKSGEGIKLQRLDSDIAEKVMLTMMDEDQLVLPVHDSFLIRSGREDRLKEVMQSAYLEVMGSKVGLDADPRWVDDIHTDDDWELHDLGVKDISEKYSALISSSDYTGFSRRRSEFVDFKGETWGHTREWFTG